MTEEELQEHIALLRRVRTDFRHVEAKLAWGGLPKRLWDNFFGFCGTQPAEESSLRAADMSPPRFEDGVSTFSVTLPRHSLVDPQTLSWLAGLGEAAQSLSRDQRNALVLMKAGEMMSNARYRQISDADSRCCHSRTRGSRKPWACRGSWRRRIHRIRAREARWACWHAIGSAICKC